MAGRTNIPGTNFAISQNFLRITLTAQEATLAAGDVLYIQHYVEGPNLRELINDVHSFSILCRSSVANLIIGIGFRTAGSPYYVLTNTLTLPATANTWSLLQLPNLPIWTPSGTWVTTPGTQGYFLYITLAAGSTYTSPANGSWQAANVVGAAGQSNFAASAVNSTFDIAFVQHEPGAVCSTLMDLDFDTNLTRSQRYFQKSYDYGAKPGSIGGTGAFVGIINANFSPGYNFIPFKRTMAKAPTMAGYSNITGAINMARDVTANVDRAVTGANNIGDAGFSGFNLSAVNAALWICNFHYTADTGW
jgi:hypothetical protein